MVPPWPRYGSTTYRYHARRRGRRALARLLRDGLGFPVLERLGEFVCFELNGFTLALFPREAHSGGAGLDPDETGTGDVSLAHNVHTREEVDDLVAEAESAGATITEPPGETEWGGYSAYFTDPDGHLWEVAAGAELVEQFI